MPFTKLEIKLKNDTDELDLLFDIKQHSTAQKWASYLKFDVICNNDADLDNNMALNGWQSPLLINNDQAWLIKELNWHIYQIKQYISEYQIDYNFDFDFLSHQTLNNEILNVLHRHFETLAGHYESTREYIEQFDEGRKFSIGQLNECVHKLENTINASKINHKSGAILYRCFPEKRYELTKEDINQFQQTPIEFGDIRLHYTQVGKHHLELFMSNDVLNKDEVQGFKYMSGNFNVDFNSTEEHAIDLFKKWLTANNVSIEKENVGIGYCVLGNLNKTKFKGMSNDEIFECMTQFDNVFSITLHENTDNVSSIYTKITPRKMSDQYNLNKDTAYKFCKIYE